MPELSIVCPRGRKPKGYPGPEPYPDVSVVLELTMVDQKPNGSASLTVASTVIHLTDGESEAESLHRVGE